MLRMLTSVTMTLNACSNTVESCPVFSFSDSYCHEEALNQIGTRMNTVDGWVSVLQWGK